MKLFLSSYLLVLFIFFSLSGSTQTIERFDHLGTADGLSQNSVLSAFCDHKGYMWFGTFNGLNRYDGNKFKVFKVEPGKENTLTHNRIVQIWEDAQKVLWVKTYDGYIHYFIPETEEFITFPNYTNSSVAKSTCITSFEQTTDKEIWLGTNNTGVYQLKYKAETGRYLTKLYTHSGKEGISHNTVNFILATDQKEILIGTEKGLNKIQRASKPDSPPIIRKYFPGENFTCGVQLDSILYFGIKGQGLTSYSIPLSSFREVGGLPAYLDNAHITLLQKNRENQLLIGTRENGLFIYSPEKSSYSQFLGNSEIKKVYQDSDSNLWVNTEKFGITRIDLRSGNFKKYQLTKDNISLLDDERQIIYEDSKNNLWIGMFGGLAIYNKKKDEFEFYKHNPSDPSSIHTSYVCSITEDKSGLLWLGLGQTVGGIEKVITTNPAFQQLIPDQAQANPFSKVVRGLTRDSNNVLWVTTKQGDLYLLHSFDALSDKKDLSGEQHVKLDHNVYSIMEDREGYIWMGTKGGGVYVSKNSVHSGKRFYADVEFYHYQHNPMDSASLSHNVVFAIYQDHQNDIWIGTYGGGLNLVEKRTPDKLLTRKFNSKNSNLSSNDVRYIFEDSRKRLWLLTTFGLNYLPAARKDNFHFQPFFYNPDDSTSISYNDLIHVTEDSKHRLWFTTLGGGVNQLLKIDQGKAYFQRFNHQNGLLNDAVYCALEDKTGQLWFSTEKGLSCFDPDTKIFENFDRDSGLPFDNFSESTGIVIENNLVFGNSGGILLVSPEKLTKTSFSPPIVFTNFQLFNKDVDYKKPQSPFSTPVDYADKIKLTHFQNSFSVEYAALSYYASSKNRYAYKLENFEESWNEVGNQQKAIYTNLPPGKYTFKVKAASWDGTWSENPRALEIIIATPWWSTTLAKIVYVILVLIIIELIRRSYTRYHNLQNDLIVEKRINQIKLQFFTNISHEIRTPLTLILGPVEDIKAFPNLPEAVNSSLTIMERNGKRLLRLVNQLLDFRKIQQNKMQLSPMVVELNTFVEEVLTNFRQLAGKKDIVFDFQTDRKEISTYLDPQLFDSVVYNIISNALKFTPHGTNIKVCIDSSHEQYIDLSVRDEGKGIPAEKMPLLFQRYSPLSSSTGQMNNTGIGLSLSYEIMKLHKGQILAESTEGKGSIFTIRILKGKSHFSGQGLKEENSPKEAVIHKEVLSDTKEPDSFIPTQVELSSEAREKFKILIVEDNPEIVGYLTDILCQEFVVNSAENGLKGLKAVDVYQPDLLVTDVMMPEMDGIEFTRIIKAAEETSHLPVIMLTAKSTVDDQVSGIESGADAYLLKPFSSLLLKATIRNLIQQRKSLLQRYLKKELPSVVQSEKKEIIIGEMYISSKDDKFLEGMIKFVEDNYSNPDFNVEKLAEHACISRSVFNNKIKGLTGYTPSEFLREIRLKIAAKLLLESDLNVSEVAYQTGFNNVKYFRNHFKNLYGINPSEFKEKHNRVKVLEESNEAVYMKKYLS